MRLSCLQENLAPALGIVGRAVATRTTLPITQNVLITTDQSRLKLSATNLEIAISTWLGAQIEEEGTLTVPARLVTELVNSLPSERIDLDTSERPTSLAVRCARFNAKINGTDAEDFPPIPSVESGLVGKVEPRVLSDAIAHVAFAAATDDSRPVLTGVKVEIAGDEFTMAGADGFRLAVYKERLVEPLSEDISFIIPARALQEISRLIGGQEQPIEFTVTPSKSQALFRLDNIEIVTQLIQGTFPDYAQLIPQDYDTKAVVNLGEFLRATRTASIFARDGSGIVRVHVTGGDNGSSGKLSIVSKAEEVGENEGDINASVEGDEAKIAFNSSYLADVLSVLASASPAQQQEPKEPEVSLETTTPSSPGVLKSVGDDRYVHVVMPMFVQW